MEKELTNNTNIEKKIKSMEMLLDIIEEDLQTKATDYIHNVVYIMPHVKVKWSLIEIDEILTLNEMIDICEDWINDLAITITYNKDKLNNKKLLAHLNEIVEICRFVIFATYNHLYGLKN